MIWSNVHCILIAMVSTQYHNFGSINTMRADDGALYKIYTTITFYWIDIPVETLNGFVKNKPA